MMNIVISGTFLIGILSSLGNCQDDNCNMIGPFLQDYLSSSRRISILLFQDNGLFNVAHTQCVNAIKGLMFSYPVSVLLSNGTRNTSLPEHPLHIVLFYSPAADAFIHQASKRGLLFDKTTWLILSSTEHLSSLKSSLSTTDMYIDSSVVTASHNNAQIELTDVYRRGISTPLTETAYGTWNPEEGLKLKKLLPKYDRRADLGGVLLRAVTVGVSKPFYISYKESGGKWVASGGYFGETFIILQNFLNFTYNLRVIPGYSYGTLLPNGSWTGVTGALQRGEVDTTSCELAMISSRFSSVDYTTPLVFISNRLYIRKPGASEVNWDAYMKPYRWDVYTCMLLMYFILASALWFLSKIKIWLAEWCKRNCTKESPGEGNSVYFSFTQCLWTFFSALTQQGSPVEPLGFSTRQVFWAGYAVFLVLNISYSATLTSFLAVIKQVQPFSNLEGLYARPEWTMGFLKGDLNQVTFQNADPGSTMNKLWSERIRDFPDKFMPDIETGILKAIQENYAFLALKHAVDDWMRTYLTYDEACKMDEIIRDYTAVGIAFGQRPGSPYRKLFSYHLLKMQNSGQLQRLQEKWLPQRPKCIPPVEVQATPEDVVSIYGLYCSGLFIAIAILLCEILTFKFWKRPESAIVNKELKIK